MRVSRCEFSGIFYCCVSKLTGRATALELSIILRGNCSAKFVLYVWFSSLIFLDYRTAGLWLLPWTSRRSSGVRRWHRNEKKIEKVCVCISRRKAVQILWWTVNCYHLFIASSATRSSSVPFCSVVRRQAGGTLAGYLCPLELESDLLTKASFFLFYRLIYVTNFNKFAFE